MIAIRKPILGITMGDTAGIGPELIVNLIADGSMEAECLPILIGDARVLAHGMKITGKDFAVNRIDDPAEADFSKGVQLIDTADIDPAGVKLGEVSAASGKASGDTLLKAVDYCKKGLLAGILFAPLNKTAMKIGGYPYESEHTFLAQNFQVTGPSGEINVLDDFMTSRVTSHIPLRDVPDHVTRERVLNAIKLLYTTQVRAGLTSPRLGVSALNPHNGENGTCGREEIDVIRPAIEDAIALGINAIGPLSADTIFVRAFKGDYDAVVTMYHDQGQIATKLKAFEKGVTIVGGLPSPIATPAHGTAFDIAGKNLADTGATRSALRAVAAMTAYGK